MTLLWLAIFTLVAFLIMHCVTLVQVSRLRSRGIYPANGQATEADVWKLVDAGYDQFALRCMREILGRGKLTSASIKQAKNSLAALKAERTKA